MRSTPRRCRTVARAPYDACAQPSTSVARNDTRQAQTRRRRAERRSGAKSETAFARGRACRSTRDQNGPIPSPQVRAAAFGGDRCTMAAALPVPGRPSPRTSQERHGFHALIRDRKAFPIWARPTAAAAVTSPGAAAAIRSRPRGRHPTRAAIGGVVANGQRTGAPPAGDADRPGRQ
jgi:hypothetical protein